MSYGSIGNPGNLTHSNYGFYKTWNGNNGRNTMNPYEMFLYEQWSVQGSPAWIYGWCPKTDMWPPNAQLALLGRLTQKVKGHDFNAGVAIAESKKTLKMATDAVNAIARSIRSAKRGNWTQALRELGADPALVPQSSGKNIGNNVSKRWLEAQYGWKPLLDDVFNAAEAAAYHMNPKRKQRLTASYVHKQMDDWSCAADAWESKGLTRSRGKTIYLLEEHLSVPRNLGLLDPGSVAWESMPWSFVIDWFIPIGNYFEVLNIIPELRGISCTSIKREHFGASVPLPAGGAELNGASQVTKSIHFTRYIGSGYDIPARPEFKPLKDSFSPTRLANAMALAYRAIFSR